ncbi:hypothetical protein [Thiosocius teredinicola]|uniref:hypothetical protein n=1 Tax=Thiosocius teredinicola TaxID=1973002 RepID=UPI000990A545
MAARDKKRSAESDLEEMRTAALDGLALAAKSIVELGSLFRAIERIVPDDDVAISGLAQLGSRLVDRWEISMTSELDSLTEKLADIGSKSQLRLRIQERQSPGDALERRIREWLEHTQDEFVTAGDILQHVLDSEHRPNQKIFQSRVSVIMGALGWRKDRKTVGGKRVHGYLRPQAPQTKTNDDGMRS